MNPIMVTSEGEKPRRLPDCDPAPLKLKVSVVREMLSVLNTLTAAGQRHTIGKIMALLEESAAAIAQRHGGRNGHALTELTVVLRQLGGHLLPDVTIFNRQAENLLTLLVALA